MDVCSWVKVVVLNSSLWSENNKDLVNNTTFYSSKVYQLRIIPPHCAAQCQSNRSIYIGLLLYWWKWYFAIILSLKFDPIFRSKRFSNAKPFMWKAAHVSTWLTVHLQPMTWSSETQETECASIGELAALKYLYPLLIHFLARFLSLIHFGFIISLDGTDSRQKTFGTTAGPSPLHTAMCLEAPEMPFTCLSLSQRNWSDPYFCPVWSLSLFRFFSLQFLGWYQWKPGRLFQQTNRRRNKKVEEKHL